MRNGPPLTPLSEAIDCRIYLCGRVTIERRGRVLTNGAPAGPQGRLLFAFLGTRRNALVSKLRAALRTVGFPPDEKPASA